MVRSETMSFGIDKSKLHKIELTANKTAILPGEEVTFTARMTDQAGQGLPNRAPLLYVNNIFRAAPINNPVTGKPYTDKDGYCKFKIRFDVPFIYQTDARGWDVDGTEVKSNVVTIFV